MIGTQQNKIFEDDDDKNKNKIKKQNDQSHITHK